MKMADVDSRLHDKFTEEMVQTSRPTTDVAMDTIREENDGTKNPNDENEDSTISPYIPRTSSAKIPTQGSRAKFVRTPDSQNELPKDHNEFTDPVLITELQARLEDSFDDGEADDDQDDLASDTDTTKAKDEDYDTDLEIDEFAVTPHDPTGRTKYVKLCEENGVVPCSYFVRHITEPRIVMKYHGLGPAGTMAIAKVLKDNITLEKIDLQGNWMEADGGRHISRMMEDNYYITELVLANNKLGSEGAYHISRMLTVNTTLKKIDLSGNEFEECDAAYFAEVLDENKVLSELRLSGNMFGEQAGDLLGPTIGGNDTLEVLDLSWNSIRRQGAVAIAQGLKENVRLKMCNLSWNGFGEEGGIAIADALTVNGTLIELDITGNRLNINCATKLARALSVNDCLQTLKIANNPISTAGAIALVSAINASETCIISFLDLSDIPVEFEFVRIVEEIQVKRAFRVLHGPLMRSGNTTDDIGKQGIDPNVRDPLIVLKEHVVVNDLRIVDALRKYDPASSLCVTPEDFTKALDELEVRYKRSQIKEISNKLDKFNNGTIYYGDLVPPDRPERGEQDLAELMSKKTSAEQ